MLELIDLALAYSEVVGCDYRRGVQPELRQQEPVRPVAVPFRVCDEEVVLYPPVMPEVDRGPGHRASLLCRADGNPSEVDGSRPPPVTCCVESTSSYMSGIRRPRSSRRSPKPPPQACIGSAGGPPASPGTQVNEHVESERRS